MDWGTDGMDQVERDMEHVRAGLKNDFHDWACFLAQQATDATLLMWLSITPQPLNLKPPTTFSHSKSSMFTI
jgi:hypothetical protein